MRLSGQSARPVRICGGLQIVLAPILWLMAGMSSVESDVTYRIQLAAFSAVSGMGLVCGVGALFGYSWAARGLFTVSVLGTAYSFGFAAYALVWLFWSTTDPKLSFPIGFALAFVTVPQGVPFLVMAVVIRRALRDALPEDVRP